MDSWTYHSLNKIMNRAWRIKEGYHADIKQLAEQLSVSPVISTLLYQRGIRTFEAARAFFRPDLTVCCMIRS